MLARARQADYFNSIINRELRQLQSFRQMSPIQPVKFSTPGSQRRSPDSLSISSIKEDPNFNHFVDTKSRPKSQFVRNQKSNSKTSDKHLNEQIFLLQEKIRSLEQAFQLAHSHCKETKKSPKNHLQKNHQNSKSKSSIQNKKRVEQTVKKKTVKEDKRNVTARLSSDEKTSYKIKSSRMTKRKSCTSLRSMNRLQNKQEQQVKQQTKQKKYQNVSIDQKNQTQRSMKMQKQKAAQYKELQKKQREMIRENQRLTKALQRSEFLRFKQKKVLHEYKLEIKQLKDTILHKKN